MNFSARTGAQGVDLEATARAAGGSGWRPRAVWNTQTSRRAQIDVEGLVVDSDVPAAELRAQRMRSKTRSS